MGEGQGGMGCDSRDAASSAVSQAMHNERSRALLALRCEQ